eukprot:ANDGO_06248.mRNA.1 Kinesin-related protein 5
MPACSIKVCIRFRPFNRRELALGESKGKFQIQDGVNLECLGNTLQHHQFAFDRIFGMNTNQPEVFEYVGRPCIEDVMQGFNGTIFAYGQTGAGKSFSMMGDLHQEEIKGIIPRGANLIFRTIDKDTSSTEYSVKCSYLEIYNETIQDLLDPTGLKKNLKIHESPQKGIYIQDLTEEYVNNEEDIYTLLDIGASNRAVASTNMNLESSRSHTVFIIEVHQKTGDGSTKSGRLNLVDLAGSEKVGKTGATGQTLEEAKGINKSLSALGLCINALVEGRKHVPYRDSKLTRILQDSLGGNTKTTLLCACSPHDDNFEETISTLKFGARAKTIKTNVKANTQKSAAELMRIIEKLKQELAALKAYCAELEKQLPSAKVAEIREKVASIVGTASDATDGSGAPALGDDESNADDENVVNNPSLVTRALESDPVASAEMAAELDRVREESRTRVANLESDLLEATQREEELRARIKTLETTSANVDSLLAAKDADHSRQSAVWNDEKNKLIFEREQVELDLEHIIAELEDAKIAREKMQKELAMTRTSFNEYKLQTGDMEKLQAEQEILFEELAAAEEKFAITQEKCDMYRQQADVNSRKAEDTLKSLKDVEKERDELYDYIQSLERDLEEATRKRIEEEGKVKQLEQTLADSRVQSGEAKASAQANAAQQLIVAQTQMEVLASEKRSLESRLEMESLRVSVLTEKNETLSKESSDLQSQVVALQEKSIAAEKRAAEAHHAAADAVSSKEAESLRARVGVLEKEKIQLESAKDVAEFEAAEAAKKSSQMQFKVNSLQTRCDALEEEVKRLRGRMQEIEVKADAEEKSKVELQQKLDESDKQVQQLKLLNENNIRRAKVWKPITKSGSSVIDAFSQKEEFGMHKLRSTGSKLLEEAREQARAADSPKASPSPHSAFSSK